MRESSDLFAEFEAARCKAIALTDEYNELDGSHSDRHVLWDRAMQQTQRAKDLLEAWLQSNRPIELRQSGSDGAIELVNSSGT